MRRDAGFGLLFCELGLFPDKPHFRRGGKLRQDVAKILAGIATAPLGSCGQFTQKVERVEIGNGVRSPTRIFALNGFVIYALHTLYMQ